MFYFEFRLNDHKQNMWSFIGWIKEHIKCKLFACCLVETRKFGFLSKEKRSLFGPDCWVMYNNSSSNNNNNNSKGGYDNQMKLYYLKSSLQITSWFSNLSFEKSLSPKEIIFFWTKGKEGENCAWWCNTLGI